MLKRREGTAGGISIVTMVWFCFGIGLAQASSSDEKKDHPKPSAPPFPTAAHVKRNSLTGRVGAAVTQVAKTVSRTAQLDFTVANPEFLQPASVNQRVPLKVTGTIDGQAVQSAFSIRDQSGKTTIVAQTMDRSGNIRYSQFSTSALENGRARGIKSVTHLSTMSEEHRRRYQLRQNVLYANKYELLQGATIQQHLADGSVREVTDVIGLDAHHEPVRTTDPYLPGSTGQIFSERWERGWGYDPKTLTDVLPGGLTVRRSRSGRGEGEGVISLNGSPDRVEVRTTNGNDLASVLSAGAKAGLPLEWREVAFTPWSEEFKRKMQPIHAAGEAFRSAQFNRNAALRDSRKQYEAWEEAKGEYERVKAALEQRGTAETESGKKELNEKLEILGNHSDLAKYAARLVKEREAAVAIAKSDLDKLVRNPALIEYEPFSGVAHSSSHPIAKDHPREFAQYLDWATKSSDTKSSDKKRSDRVHLTWVDLLGYSSEPLIFDEFTAQRLPQIQDVESSIKANYAQRRAQAERSPLMKAMSEALQYVATRAHPVPGGILPGYSRGGLPVAQVVGEVPVARVVPPGAGHVPDAKVVHNPSAPPVQGSPSF